MILSSADIFNLIGGDPVIRLLAKIQIVDGKPPLTGEEGLFVYIDRFPEVEEFEATWKIWVIDYSDEPVDIVVNTIEALLPQTKVSKTGLGYQVTTTEFKSASTQVKPEEEVRPAIAPDFSEWEDRFQTLVEDVQDQMLLVTSGRPGKDGKDGADGKDGKDGTDLLATEANLDDLKDVDIEGRIALQKGHVLTWDGTVWTNLFIPQVFASGATGGTATANVPENCDVHDGGDFDTGTAYAPTCGGLTTTLVNVATYQILVTDFYIGVNYDGLVTLTMPANVNEGLKYVIKDESGKAGQPANYITIQGSGNDLIDGEATVILGYNYGSLTLIWRDGAWRIV